MTTTTKQTQEALRVEQALKLALELLDEAIYYTNSQAFSPSMTRDIAKGIAAIRSVLNEHGEALAHAPTEREQPAQQEPVGWFESPHGEFRANPLHKTAFPSSLLSWKIPLYAWPVRETNDGDELTVAYMSGLHRGKELALAEQPASKPWVGLTEDDLAVCDTDGRPLARYWERVLREKNA